ncbi:hypothetical protein [Longispora albida]|uniref:hypothetical protein n=1 Tax=Longispora albida TaxID=203523 RepID=UPI0003676D5A|nr:hypothetical protein [Longispora albida]
MPNGETIQAYTGNLTAAGLREPHWTTWAAMVTGILAVGCGGFAVVYYMAATSNTGSLRDAEDFMLALFLLPALPAAGFTVATPLYLRGRQASRLRRGIAVAFTAAGAVAPVLVLVWLAMIIF